jgi:hypothetical protein
MPDPPHRTGDQDALPLLQGAVVEQTLPRAQGGEWDRGARDVVQGARLGGEDVGRDGGVLGGDAVAVERGECEARVADRDALDVVSHGGHDPRELVRRDRGEPVDGPGQLVTRDRRGVHTDEPLPRTQRGCLDVVQREGIETARRVEPQGSHPPSFAPIADRTRRCAGRKTGIPFLDAVA